MPQEVSLHADAVVLGEAEATMGRLLSDFKNRKLLKNRAIIFFVDDNIAGRADYISELFNALIQITGEFLRKRLILLSAAGLSWQASPS